VDEYAAHHPPDPRRYTFVAAISRTVTFNPELPAGLPVSCELKAATIPTAGEPFLKFLTSNQRAEHPSRADLSTCGRKMMNRRSSTVVLAGTTVLGLAIAIPQTAFAQSDPLIGTWKLNLAKSTFSPGPQPRSRTVTTLAEGQGHKFTLEEIDAEGNPSKAVIMTFNDGKSHPVTAVPAYDAASDKQVSDSTGWVIRTKAGKVVQTLIGETSADGKTWTITTAGVTPDGQQLYNVAVYDKR
jgi:hypothetical protein